MQFVDQEVWQKKSVDELTHSPVDAIWVRKWKWKEKTRIVKSRLCARGFLDSQGYMLNTRATTASRLTQRLLLSVSVLLEFKVETWDVNGAFIKGFPFSEVRKHLAKTGMRFPEREVSIRPPANVWRHLREINGE